MKYISFYHTFQQIRVNLVLPDLISARLLFPSNRSEVSCCHIIANMSNLSPARIASFTILLVYPNPHLYYICILYSILYIILHTLVLVLSLSCSYTHTLILYMNIIQYFKLKLSSNSYVSLTYFQSLTYCNLILFSMLSQIML